MNKVHLRPMDTFAKTWRHGSAAASLVGAAGFAALMHHAPAQAMLPPVAFVGAIYCHDQRPDTGLMQQEDPVLLAQSKAAAILGGQQSALALISSQQGDQSNETAAPLINQAKEVGKFRSPACPSARVGATQSSDFFKTPTMPTDEFLGSSRISIGRTPFDNAWSRVSRRRSLGKLQLSFRKPHEIGLNELQQVNDWVNTNLTYSEDIDLYGRRDYWATGHETLRKMKGDCEDYAILKYQLLAYLGVATSDMFLTLVRDRIRQRDHAVLVVKMSNQFYLLDNSTPDLLLADEAHEYSARLSYSESSAWLHGYTAPARANPYNQRASLAYLSESAVSKARLTGLSR